MNLAKAKRRWKAWRRWKDQVIALCGESHKGLPGEMDAYNEHVRWRNTGNWGRRMARRINRRAGNGWRR